MKNGFTLIELLIVIVILGILSSIAYPSYIDSVRKSKRSEAQSALMKLANLQEQYYLDLHQYTADLTKLGFSDPYISEHEYYSIKASAASPTTGFILTATAINEQSQDTDCATMSISHDLLKDATSEGCWK